MVSFVCQSINNPGIQQFQWLVNGTPLEDNDQRDGIEEHMTRTTGILTFLNVTVEYNNTTIQCIANYTSGAIMYSNSAKLLVQGEEVCKIIKSTP